MKVLRTPDSAFDAVKKLYPYEPKYLTISNGLRVAYVDEGPRDAPPVLLMHGEPSWSFLYRGMIAELLRLGHRVVAPDLVGFGRSDKPVETSAYSFEGHVAWMTAWLRGVNLARITLFCQDWGGLIGLRLVAAMPERFDRVCAANTFLPTGQGRVSTAFQKWRQFSQTVPEFPTSMILQGATVRELSDEELAAYDAPYPTEAYKAGARIFPVLVPITPDAPGAAENRRAWHTLERFRKPFLTAFSDKDPVTAGLEVHLQERIAGCAGQKHVTIKDGGHFLQEDKPVELAQVVHEFMSAKVTRASM